MGEVLRIIRAEALEALGWWWRAIRAVAPWFLAAVAILAAAELLWRAFIHG